MFEDKELLNTILYEKRYSTYLVCVIMIVIGILLCFIKVPDKKITEAYNSKYPAVIWTDKPEILSKINIRSKDNKRIITNMTDKNIIGIYINNEYIKKDFKPLKPCEISQKENLTGVVYLENE